MSNLRPSKYQKAILDACKQAAGPKIIVIEAGPGAGKTSTLAMIAKQVIGNQQGIALAFNTEIARAMTEKFHGTGVKSKTIHSMGYGAVAKNLPGSGRLDVQQYKYSDLLRMWEDVNGKLESEQRSAVLDLIKFVFLELTASYDRASDEIRADVDRLYDIARDRDIFIDEGTIDIVQWALRKGWQQAQTLRLIDFNEMVALPVLLDWDMYQPPWLLVDECQDLSVSRLKLVLKMVGRTTRVVFVGDPHQAIYRFAGADGDAFARIQHLPGAVTLPLSICYRCPASHIAEFNTILGTQIEAREGAQEGTIETLTEGELFKKAQVGSIILCRTTAPLISLCIRFIKQGVRARVRGRDMGRELVGIIQKIANYEGFSWDKFGIFLDRFISNKIKYLMRKEASEATIQNWHDKRDALDVLAESVQSGETEFANSVDGLMAYTEYLFDDTQSPIWLMTAHRAKGLEAEQVFIYKPGLMPLEWPGQGPEEYEQELNLKYVATSRSLDYLGYVV